MTKNFPAKLLKFTKLRYDSYVERRSTGEGLEKLRRQMAPPPLYPSPIEEGYTFLGNRLEEDVASNGDAVRRRGVKRT